jgi:hypothetical protein
MKTPFLRLLTLFSLLHLPLYADSAVMQGRLLEFSCAAFPSNLSEADIVGRYGRQNVVSAPIVGSDDGPQDGTVVFPDQPQMKLEIFWHDPELKTKPRSIMTRGSGSPWRTPNGITVGMDLISIERANGRPFRLGALSTEGQGRVRSWGNGRLKMSDPDGCAVAISLYPMTNSNVERSLASQVLRGREFSSGHPAMQSLNPRVGAIAVGHSIAVPR